MFLRHWPSVIACALAAVLLIAAWQVASTNARLAAVSKERVIERERDLASNVSQVFGRYRKDAELLARAREIENYFVNLDLGMSRTYGLNLNLEFIDSFLRAHVGRRGERTDTAFRSIALYDEKGEILASTNPSAAWVPVRANSQGDTTEIDTANRTLRTSVDVLVKGRSRGTLVATADLSRLSVPLRPVLTMDHDLRFVVFKSGELIQIATGNAVNSLDLRTLLSELPDQRPSIFSTLPQNGQFSDMFLVAVDIPDSPFSLLTLKEKTELFSDINRDHTAAFLGVLALVILAATFVVFRMGLRAERLQTIYEMARKHQAALQHKNVELSAEISHRQIVEHDLKTKSEELDRTNENLKIAATAFESQEGMAVLDMGGRILRVNAALARLMGCEPNSLLGRLFEEMIVDEEAGGLGLNTALREGCPWKGDVRTKAVSAAGASLWFTLSPVMSDKGLPTSMIGTFYDVSDRRKAERQIKRLAFYDQLTGLPNRHLATDRTIQAMRTNAQSGEFGALLFIDLDQFKRLNDTLGHDVGDKLLKAVADRISRRLGGDSTVARFGGDEFVVLLPTLKTVIERDAALLAEHAAELVLRIFKQPFQLEGYEHNCSTSIGIALFSAPLETFDDILKRADIAMYEAKGAGGNVIRFFDPEMQRVVREEVSLDADLRTAVDRGEFEFHLQPQINRFGTVVGAEVLLRWPHPVRGLVSPGVFIPIAEKSGLIVPLGNWVLDCAAKVLSNWAAKELFSDINLSINVSANQLHSEDFVETVLGAIERHGARPRRLKLEITESLLVNNLDDAIRKMTALQQHEILFSLDDFGTGYSSLSYLKQLPLDQLKIDRSFVSDLPQNKNDAAIAEMIVALGRTLGLHVIAEGVETEEQKGFLEGIGCDQFQGYLFGVPMPLDQFEEFVSALGSVSHMA